MEHIKTWIKAENTPNLTIDDFKEGDLVKYWSTGNYVLHVGEIVRIVNNQLFVHFLETQIEQKLWRFNEDTVHIISPINVCKHVGCLKETLTKEIVRNMWDLMGYVVGVHDFCLKEHEDIVPLDIAPGDSDSESDDDIDDEMKDFIVPDSEGEAFCHPKMKDLTEEQQKWVSETHKAVSDWNQWQPKDDQQKAIKSFVDNMSLKYSSQEDQRRFQAGQASLDYNTPS